MKFYGWKTVNDMVLSFAPSLKYKMTLKIMSLSTVIAYFETSIFGFKIETFIALIILLITELLSGIYCSIKIRNEAFESSKMWRFWFKAGMFFIISYAMFQLQKEFQDRPLLDEIFTWVYNGLLAYAILEIVISVLENYAEIQGKQKDYYSNFIKQKLNNIFGNEKNNSDTPTPDNQ